MLYIRTCLNRRVKRHLKRTYCSKGKEVNILNEYKAFCPYGNEWVILKNGEFFCSADTADEAYKFEDALNAGEDIEEDI